MSTEQQNFSAIYSDTVCLPTIRRMCWNIFWNNLSSPFFYICFCFQADLSWGVSTVKLFSYYWGQNFQFSHKSAIASYDCLSQTQPIGWECPVFPVLSSKEILVLPFHICKPISRVQLLICSIIRYLLQKITVSSLDFNCITKGTVELSLNSKHSSFFTLCRPVLNPQLEDLILRMLTKDPSERITIQQIKVCQQKFDETGAEVVIERVVMQHAQV